MIKLKVKLRPYGTSSFLAVKGQAKEKITATQGKQYDTYMYVVGGENTKSLLELEIATKLRILKISREGADINKVDKIIAPLADMPSLTKVIIDRYPNLFTWIIKFENKEVNFHMTTP